MVRSIAKVSAIYARPNERVVVTTDIFNEYFVYKLINIVNEMIGTKKIMTFICTLTGYVRSYIHSEAKISIKNMFLLKGIFSNFL